MIRTILRLAIRRLLRRGYLLLPAVVLVTVWLVLPTLRAPSQPAASDRANPTPAMADVARRYLAAAEAFDAPGVWATLADGLRSRGPGGLDGLREAFGRYQQVGRTMREGHVIGAFDEPGARYVFAVARLRNESGEERWEFYVFTVDDAGLIARID